MKIKKYNIQVFEAVSFIFLLCVFITGCSTKAKENKNAKNIKNVVINQIEDDKATDYKQEVQSFKLEGFSKTGENQWSVQGKFANILEPDVVLKSIKGKSTSKDLKVTLYADRGIYNKETRSAEMKGNVVVVLSDGGKIFMDYANWNAVDEEISTKSPVRIEHNGVVLEGVGGIVQPQKEWARIDQNIKIVDSTGRVITCDGPLEINYKENNAILNNNVLIVDQQGKMKSDKVIVYFSREKKQIDRIEWLGNVQAVY